MARPSRAARALPSTTKACNSRATCGWKASGWGQCSKSCGTGTKTRSVGCYNGGSKVSDSWCSGSKPATSTSCHLKHCPINCVVSGWGSWGACSRTCGKGVQSRSRSITTSPQHGGASCPALTSSQKCNTHTCENFHWHESGFGVCGAACGASTKTQAVKCVKSNVSWDKHQGHVKFHSFTTLAEIQANFVSDRAACFV